MDPLPFPSRKETDGRPFDPNPKQDGDGWARGVRFFRWTRSGTGSIGDEVGWNDATQSRPVPWFRTKRNDPENLDVDALGGMDRNAGRRPYSAATLDAFRWGPKGTGVKEGT